MSMLTRLRRLSFFHTTFAVQQSQSHKTRRPIAAQSHPLIAVMGSISTDTPALATNPKFIFFTDFDGTITTADSNDYMIDNLGCGKAKREADNGEVLAGRAHFRDVFYDMLDSVKTPFDECLRLLLANIELDPGFKEFYHWAQESNVPIVILSGGMEPVIRALLDKMLGPGWNMQIVSNNVAPAAAAEGRGINEEGGWKIAFHDDSIHGHDKSIEIRKYSSLPSRPVMFYAGDGVSDLSAAKETDLLFAKQGKDLVTWCENAKIPFVTFRDWTSIGQTVKDIASGTITLQEAARGRI